MWKKTQGLFLCKLLMVLYQRKSGKSGHNGKAERKQRANESKFKHGQHHFPSQCSRMHDSNSDAKKKSFQSNLQTKKQEFTTAMQA